MVKLRYVPALAMALAVASCGDGYDEFEGVAPENLVNPGDMVIKMGRGISDLDQNDLTTNTRLFQFHADTDTTGRGSYVTRPRLKRLDDNTLTFTLGEGYWDFSMVWAREEGITDRVIEPEYGRRAEECPMWEVKSEGNTLPDAPEIYTALVDLFKFSGKWVIDPETNVDHFEPDKDYHVDAQYVRNVAKLEVTFESSEDLDPTQPQNISISNVPTTLNWRGGLYPDKYSPAVSASPLRGQFALETIGENLTQGTNELQYIIPAHRGVDYATPLTAVDTTTSLLRLNVDLVCLDGTHVVKNNVVLDRAPRVNGRYQIKVSYNKRKLNVETEILPWVEENASASAGNSTIITDKASIEMSHLDTLRITSPHTVTVSRAADAPWITLKKITDTKYVVEADVDSYEVGHPRSSYLILRDGNLERRIPVTQRPETGTIDVKVSGTANSREMWLSPPHNQKQVDVVTTGGGWKILPNLRVYDDVSGGVGESANVTLTRFADEDIDYSDYNKAFGRERVVFMNTETLDTASIWVDNLFIGLTDDIVEISQPDGHGAIVYQQDECDFVAVYGGSADVTILSLPDFIKSDGTFYNPSTGIFTFNSMSDPNGDDRWGWIELGHKSDPDYKVRLAVDQAILVNTPEFDYLVVKYIWDVTKGDVDTKTGFTGNPLTYNYHDIAYNTSYVDNLNDYFVGWSMWNSTLMWNFTTGANGVCLAWGGDATGGQGETVFFNARDINKFPYPGQRGSSTADADKMIPRVVSMICCGSWYSTAQPTSPITCRITCYLGGEMYKGTSTAADQENDKNFYNRGGSKVFEEERSFTTSWLARNAQYVKMATIDYDRKRHNAKVTWGSSSDLSSGKDKKSGAYGSGSLYVP